MGQYQAHLPGDRRYCRNHMWAQATAGGWRVGFTAYAIRLMQDVYFLEWSVDPGTPLPCKARIGYIETSKAQSELYAPFAGVITTFNDALMHDPSLINLDGYGQGWLFEMTTSPMSQPPEDSMSVHEYQVFLTDAWTTAQRLIKGQINALSDDANEEGKADSPEEKPTTADGFTADSP